MSDSWSEQRDSLCLKIQNKFKIQPFQSKNLLIAALTSNDKISIDNDFKINMKNDRKKDLATIGDKVIDYLIFERFKDDFKGENTRTAEYQNHTRETHGNNKILHKISKTSGVNIDEDIFWTDNDKCAKNGKTCLAIYFEALVAVIFIDHGIDEVRKFFSNINFFENVEKLNENKMSSR